MGGWYYCYWIVAIAGEVAAEDWNFPAHEAAPLQMAHHCLCLLPLPSEENVPVPHKLKHRLPNDYLSRAVEDELVALRLAMILHPNHHPVTFSVRNAAALLSSVSISPSL